MIGNNPPQLACKVATLRVRLKATKHLGKFAIEIALAALPKYAVATRTRLAEIAAELEAL